MQIESHADVLLEEVVTAFWQATDDTLQEAKRRAGQHKRTGKFQDSLEATQPVVDGETLRSRVGSPLSSARVKELGGFMQPRHGSRIRFRLETGAWVTLQAFRVAARPVVVPAGRLFPDFFRARLAQLRGSAGGASPVLGGGLVTPGKADVRSGPVTL
jgi:hypothetical protein